MKVEEVREEQSEKHRLKQSGKRLLIINIIFFLVLLGGLFLVPFSGLIVAAVVIGAAFVVSIIYIYRF